MLKTLCALMNRTPSLSVSRGELARLRATSGEVAALQRALERAQRVPHLQEVQDAASFTRTLFELRRTTLDLRAIDWGFRHPLRQLPFKLHNYRLATSHGVPVPTVLAVWSHAREITLESLPDHFVLKTDGGSSSRGVMPVRRVGTDAYVVAAGSDAVAGREVVAAMKARLVEGKVSPPVFAEDFLEQPDGDEIPDDIKIYACYGQVILTLIRRVKEHGDSVTTTCRYLADDGRDLGKVMPAATLDSKIQIPHDYLRMVEIAKHLSRAVGTSFVRVDLYQTTNGPVLGELTRGPGGSRAFVSEHDIRMGAAWDKARYRLDLDLAIGRPFGRLYGEHPAPSLYPSAHWSQAASSDSWAPTVSPCSQWCLSTAQASSL